MAEEQQWDPRTVQEVDGPEIDEHGRIIHRFIGGGQREQQEGRPRFDLLLPLAVPFGEQFLTRCAKHLGESKYPERNWEEFKDQAALNRCKASAARHFVQWMTGADDGEDHAAAVFFNLMAAEFVSGRMKGHY